LAYCCDTKLDKIVANVMVVVSGQGVSQDDILQKINADGSFNSQIFASERSCEHQKVVGILRSLAGREVVTLNGRSVEKLVLSSEAQTYVGSGSPEVQVFKFVQKMGTTTKEQVTNQLGDVAAIGFGTAMKNKWLQMDASKNVSVKCENVEDDVQKMLATVQEKTCSIDALPKKQLDMLTKRKLVKKESLTVYDVEKGPKFTLDVKKAQMDLTAEMILTGSWKEADFKPLNLNALGMEPKGGQLHPLLKVRSEIRSILINMGFQEMPTNRWVESSFWNFDTLFQPQQHPARDAHDTFFLKNPVSAVRLPKDDGYMQRVKDMHMTGGDISRGWRYDWSEQETSKNLLRTHTTAVSSRVLYEMGQHYQKTGEFTPKKCFSIDRVFRNETLDATHLAEFHQVEFFVADRNLTLGHLIGVLKEFYARHGIHKLRFKPAYNPYTEPSMEVFGYHPILGKWVEIGNSGVFRPEMLAPMGLPADVQVIAGGLSLERPTMIQYNIAKIQELFGYRLSRDWLKTVPICWMNGEEPCKAASC